MVKTRVLMTACLVALWSGGALAIEPSDAENTKRLSPRLQELLREYSWKSKFWPDGYMTKAAMTPEDMRRWFSKTPPGKKSVLDEFSEELDRFFQKQSAKVENREPTLLETAKLMTALEGEIRSSEGYEACKEIGGEAHPNCDLVGLWDHLGSTDSKDFVGDLGNLARCSGIPVGGDVKKMAFRSKVRTCAAEIKDMNAEFKAIEAQERTSKLSHSRKNSKGCTVSADQKSALCGNGRTYILDERGASADALVKQIDSLGSGAGSSADDAASIRGSVSPAAQAK